MSGASNRTHAERGPSRAQRARDDAGFFLFHQHGARSSPSSWRGVMQGASGPAALAGRYYMLHFA